MNRYHKIISSALILVLLFTLINISAFAAKDPIEAEYAKGRLIVQFDTSLTEKQKDNIKKDLEVTTIKKLTTNGLEVINYNANQSIESVLAKVNGKKGVILAEPDYILRTEVVDPTEYGSLWGLNQANDIDIDAPEAWSLGLGTNDVIVAVIDTGVQIDHPDLLGRFVPGFDFYNDDSSVYDGLDDDHGTHVSGTILANANGFGVVGVAGENVKIKIMPLKFIGPNGGYTSDAIDAINYAKANHAQIISASWGGGGYSDLLKAAIENFGGPFIAAAGNSKTNNDRRAFYPAGYNSPNIISVAAVDANGALASFSNYGATTVDIGAPGVSIKSTVPDSTYAFYSGTSMATPHVSGVAALLLSQDPTLSTQDLIGILYSSGMPLPSLEGKTVTGKMLNAYAALYTLTGSPPTDPPVDPPVEQTLLIVSSIPTEGSKNVKISSGIVLTTNIDIEGVDPLKVSLINGLGTAVPIDCSFVGTTLTVKPQTNLTTFTSYKLQLGLGALSNTLDVDGSDPFVLNFTTGRK